MSKITVACKGARYTIEWARDQRGRMPAREYFENEISVSQQARILSLFRRLAESGRISNREHFRQLGKKAGTQARSLWEFKNFQLRFLGDFRPNGRFVVAVGLKKKRDRLSRKDIDRAVRVLQEHDER